MEVEIHQTLKGLGNKGSNKKLKIRELVRFKASVNIQNCPDRLKKTAHFKSGQRQSKIPRHNPVIFLAKSRLN